MLRLSILAFITILLFPGCKAQTASGSLSADAFAAKLKEMPAAQLVDVRTSEEFKLGHLPSAWNIDWNGAQFTEQISKLDKTKPVFVYCLSGGRSGEAAAQMRADGFKEVYELNGGIMKCRSAHLPETRTAAANTGMTRQQFEALLQTDKTVLVDFYADWCAPCRKMKPYLDEISSSQAAKLTLIRINADENPALCQELHVDALPVLQVYKQQQLSWSNAGYIEKDALLPHL